MNKTKKWIIAGAALVCAGLVTCTAAMAVLGFDFKKLSTVKLAENTYEVSGTFSNISINCDTEDISFARSEDGSCKVLCYEEENDRHQVSVENDTLNISRKNRHKLHFFSIFADSPKITVYLPQETYADLTVSGDTGYVAVTDAFSFANINISLDTGDINCMAGVSGTLKIQTDTGDISLSGISPAELTLISDAGDMELRDLQVGGTLSIREDTGDVTMQNVTCRNLTAEGSAGDLSMTDVTAEEAFDLKRDTGDISFSGCDAASITVRTDTGDVSGTLRSDKVFLVKSDTGDIDVPKTVEGGRCEITTDTGDIQIRVQ